MTFYLFWERFHLMFLSYTYCRLLSIHFCIFAVLHEYIICFLCNIKSTVIGKIDHNNCTFNIVYLYYFVRSFITSPAMIRPTTDGTNAVDPGMSRRSVHLWAAPGGQIQCVLQLIDISSIGRIGFS